MSEELKNIEMEDEMETENNEVTVYNMEPYESSNGISGGLVVGGLALFAAGCYALYKKFKPSDDETKAEKKRLKNEKKIKELEKDGYVVYRADEVEVEDFEDDVEDDLEETEEKK